jgi:large subunit ribosomal protein L18
VFKSAKHIYAQIVNDTEGRTLAAASSLKLGAVATAEASKKKSQAEQVGKAIAEVAKQHGITQVRFDRGGYPYHGRVAALAESARQNGLKF